MGLWEQTSSSAGVESALTVAVYNQDHWHSAVTVSNIAEHKSFKEYLMASFHYCMVCKSFNKLGDDLKPCARCVKEIEERTAYVRFEAIDKLIWEEMLSLRSEDAK